MPDDRGRLLALLRDHAVLRGDFVLSSGKHATYYIDARRVTLSAEGSLLCGRLLFDLVHDWPVHGTAGPTLGADPLVTAVAVTSAQRDHPLDAFIVRKEHKAHGVGRMIEGPWRDGVPVAVLEDAVTTGGSVLRAAHAVAEQGGVVVGIATLIDRQEGGAAAVEAAGYPFRAVFTVDELLGDGTAG